MTERKTATRKTEKNAAQNDAPDPEKTQQKKAARRGRPPKADKEPTPEKPSKDEKKRPAFQDRRRKIGSAKTEAPARHLHRSQKRFHGQMNRNELFTSHCPSFMPSKTIRFRYVTMRI